MIIKEKYINIRDTNEWHCETHVNQEKYFKYDTKRSQRICPATRKLIHVDMVYGAA